MKFSLINRSTGRPTDGNLTAASLIDAIITHQISQTTTEPPRDGHRSFVRNKFILFIFFLILKHFQF